MQSCTTLGSPMSDQTQPADGRWQPMASAELIPLFRSVSAPWWVAGGLAIDLFLGRTTRSHGDLDAEVLRRDLPPFAGALQGWSLFAAKDGRLTLYRGDLAEGVNGLWIRRDDDAPWAVE